MSFISVPSKPKYSWWLRLLFIHQQKKYNKIAEPLLLWGRVPTLFFCFMLMLIKLKRKGAPISKQVDALIRVRVSQLISCSYCTDLNLSEAYDLGLTLEKIEDLQNYPNSSFYSELEKALLTYVDAVVKYDKGNCKRNLLVLEGHFTSDQLIEVTALITHQAMSAMFNTALGAEAFGFCTLPRVAKK